MKNFWLETLPRSLLGVIFLVSALEALCYIVTGVHLIHFPLSERGKALYVAMESAGFLLPLQGLVELIGACCLLSNRAAAFGFAILVPVMVVIVLFNFCLNSRGIPGSVLIIVCGALLARVYASCYADIFAGGRRKTAPV